MNNSTTSEAVTGNTTGTTSQVGSVSTNGTIDWSTTLASKKINKSKERATNTTTHNLKDGGMGVAF